MPRIAAPRAAAEPSSPQQKERHRRILRAAAQLGSERDLEQVQMLDVAKEAGVALATLYRYFPSKTHLFTSVMASQIDRLRERVVPAPLDDDPVDQVVELLLGASRQLLSRPMLARAIITSNNAAHAGAVPIAAQNAAFAREIVLGALGLTDPTPRDLALARLLVQCWYGSLTQALNDHLAVEDVLHDIRLASRILLAQRSTVSEAGLRASVGRELQTGVTRLTGARRT